MSTVKSQVEYIIYTHSYNMLYMVMNKPHVLIMS